MSAEVTIFRDSGPWIRWTHKASADVTVTKTTAIGLTGGFLLQPVHFPMLVTVVDREVIGALSMQGQVSAA
jgi:hypothetical protein